MSPAFLYVNLPFSFFTLFERMKSVLKNGLSVKAKPLRLSSICPKTWLLSTKKEIRMYLTLQKTKKERTNYTPFQNFFNSESW